MLMHFICLFSALFLKARICPVGRECVYSKRLGVAAEIGEVWKVAQEVCREKEGGKEEQRALFKKSELVI